MCRSWLRPDNLLLRSRFRAASEARRKSVLKLFANLRSCKSLDRQRVSGGWLCARCEAFLHHILRSMGGKCWLCIKYYHYLYSALDSQRAALPPAPTREGFFHFALSVPSWPTPALKKAERGKVCQFSVSVRHYLSYERKWKFSASETSDCKTTGGREGYTSCNAEDHSAIKQWRNQKFSLNSSGTEKVLSFYLAQKQTLCFSSEEKDHRSLPREVKFFSSKYLQAVFWLQGAHSTNPILLTLYVTHSDYFYWLQMQTNCHQCCTAVPQLATEFC